jgi:hypothetical protein
MFLSMFLYLVCLLSSLSGAIFCFFCTFVGFEIFQFTSM